LRDQEILERLQEIQSLTPKDREALLHILDALLAKNRFRSIAEELDQSERAAG
jgi:FixJ family two-component response regulator